MSVPVNLRVLAAAVKLREFLSVVGGLSHGNALAKEGLTADFAVEHLPGVATSSEGINALVDAIDTAIEHHDIDALKSYIGGAFCAAQETHDVL